MSMIAELIFDKTTYRTDLSKPVSLALPFVPHGRNVNCYYADEPIAEVIRMGDFVGSVAEGGTVNYQKITFTPHGNGTHTECIGHITDDPTQVMCSLMKRSFFKAQIISLRPRPFDEDFIITLNDIHQYYDREFKAEALIIRSMPNDYTIKVQAQYSGTNPPYFEPVCGDWFARRNIKHLVVDLPSVDKEVDGGALSVHRGFWQTETETPRTEATITELAFIPQNLSDGRCLLQITWPNWNTDCAPSSPLVYKFLSDTENNS
jgi:arylformamidase